jgi:hypothetical protein
MLTKINGRKHFQYDLFRLVNMINPAINNSTTGDKTMTYRGSILARTALTALGLPCWKLYTQKRAYDRTYKIYGHYGPHQLGPLLQELAALGAMNVRPVPAIIGNGNAGVRFEY